MQQKSDAHAGQSWLAVDLDGSLLRSDLLAESVLALLARNVLYLFLLPVWLLKGRARLKREVARRIRLDAARLPYNQAVLAFIRQERAAGRPVVLATASDGLLAEDVADHLGLFDAVIASDGVVNMKGSVKRDAIVAMAGDRPFDYIGDSRADLAIFEAADKALLVDPSPGVLATARRSARVAALFTGGQAGARTYLEEIRIRQWMKNLLVFVPLLLDHRIADPASWREAAVAFLAFSLCASSVYLLNDLLDLQADRRHPRKRERPLASGRLPLAHGLVLAPLLLLAAALVALALPPLFKAVLAVYYLATLAYSLFFKRTLLFDVLLLASLYTLRIIAGAAALALPMSFWLLAFSIFLFLSLALMKRFVELGALGTKGEKLLTGRGYRAEDLETLSQFGTGSGLLAVLVLALYIDSAEVKALYRYPEIIWLICPMVLYLVMRFWVLARRREMSDDPVVFATRDWRSQVVVVLAVAVLFIAAG
ncbi:MAG: UbiA family prenyltransferase [Hyphomicrobiaceae bacterium]